MGCNGSHSVGLSLSEYVHLENIENKQKIVDPHAKDWEFNTGQMSSG